MILLHRDYYMEPKNIVDWIKIAESNSELSFYYNDNSLEKLEK